MKKAVILAVARTGSNLLGTLLSSQPEFCFHGELFAREQVQGLLFPDLVRERLGADPTEIRNEDPVRFLELILEIAPPHKHVVGFKLFLYHFREVVRRVLSHADYAAVLIDRENRLASYSSLRIAERTGMWKSKEKTRERPAQMLHFTPEDFSRYRKQIDDSYMMARQALAARANYIEIGYTEIQDPVRLRAVVDFLSDGRACDRQLTTSLRKQNTRRILERFANTDEVVDYLRAIGKEGWADSG